MGTVSTKFDNSADDEGRRADGEADGLRKAAHLDICIDEKRFDVESGSSGFEEVRFLHRALPEVAEPDVRTETEFLGHPVRLPLFISSMTGGSDHGYNVNKELARAAQACGIPVGMGSIRIIFRKPEVIEHFQLKRYAPDVPVFANIGGVQLIEMDHDVIYEGVRRLEVQGIAVHLNPGQELFQPEGDRDFRGIAAATARFAEGSPVPVLVKETGFGIDPISARMLLESGARYIDVAGAGGTNWVQVERHRLSGAAGEAAEEFRSWGIATAPLIGALRALGVPRERLLASGGVRNGLDICKALALGAHSVGLALPFVRAVHAGGYEAVTELIGRYEKVLRSAMVLSGCVTLEEFAAATLLTSSSFREQRDALIDAGRTAFS